MLKRFFGNSSFICGNTKLHLIIWTFFTAICHLTTSRHLSGSLRILIVRKKVVFWCDGITNLFLYFSHCHISQLLRMFSTSQTRHFCIDRNKCQSIVRRGYVWTLSSRVLQNFSVHNLFLIDAAKLALPRSNFIVNNGRFRATFSRSQSQQLLFTAVSIEQSLQFISFNLHH